MVVTGTFDQWSSSVTLKQSESGFEGAVRVPWGEKILYKFVVDGKWQAAPGRSTETDGCGNVNNVYYSPEAPAPVAVPADPSPLQAVKAKIEEVVSPATIMSTNTDEPTSTVTTNGVVPAEPSPIQAVKAKVEEVVQNITPTTLSTSTAEPASTVTDKSAVPADSGPSTIEVVKAKVEEIVQNIAPTTTTTSTDETTPTVTAKDLVDTVIAKDGTTSAASYIASGVGMVIGSLVGVDPINGAQLPVQTPALETVPDQTNTVETVPDKTEERPPTPDVAPKIPVEILPLSTVEVPTLPVETKAGSAPINGDVSTHQPADVIRVGEPPVQHSEVEATPSAASATPAPAEPSTTPAAAAPTVASATPTAATPTAAFATPSEPKSEVPKPKLEAPLTSTQAPLTTTQATPTTPPAPSTPPPQPPASAPKISSDAARTSISSPNGNGLHPRSSFSSHSPPTTPKKQAFPRSDSPTASPGKSGKESLRGSPSRFSTASRKKRDSIFGKIKGMFSHNKESSK